MTLSVSRFVYDSWASCFSWHEICSTCVLDMSCLYVHLPKLVNLHLTLKWKKLRWRYLLGIESSAFLQRPYCTSSIHRSVYRSICTANSYQQLGRHRCSWVRIEVYRVTRYIWLTLCWRKLIIDVALTVGDSTRVRSNRQLSIRLILGDLLSLIDIHRRKRSARAKFN